MPERLEGYSYTGAACMYARLGDGDRALAALDRLHARLTPNGFYRERGGPVIETPLSLLESVAELLVHSWYGPGQPRQIVCFPAVPRRWRTVRFGGIRSACAMRVDGERVDGRNRLLRFHAHADSRFLCRPNLDAEDGSLHWSDASCIRAVDVGRWEIDLPAGRTLAVSCTTG